jgi:hypothetical protein
MNCGLCIGFLRQNKPCGGCFKKEDLNKPKVCRSCVIVNCESLKKTMSGYCFECNKYPCTRLKNLDARYRRKYKMSMIENLDYIQLYGLDAFLKSQQEKWTCKVCQSGLCVHRDYCLHCNTRIWE